MFNIKQLTSIILLTLSCVNASSSLEKISAPYGDIALDIIDNTSGKWKITDAYIELRKYTSNFTVFLKVKNISSPPDECVRFLIKLYDKDGVILTSRENFVRSDEIDKGEIGKISQLITDAELNDIDRIKINVNWYP